MSFSPLLSVFSFVSLYFGAVGKKVKSNFSFFSFEVGKIGTKNLFFPSPLFNVG
jgi:hypothetical protein